jgi:FtsZ-binding cell division protein ZapB
MNNNECKKVIIRIGNDDIYFIIDSKETSILKMMNELEKKVTKFALGGWIALGLTVIIALPVSIFQIGLVEIKEQNAELDKQNAELDKQNDKFAKEVTALRDRVLILETQLKTK